MIYTFKLAGNRFGFASSGMNNNGFSKVHVVEKIQWTNIKTIKKTPFVLSISCVIFIVNLFDVFKDGYTPLLLFFQGE